MQKLFILATAALVAVVLAACGGDDGPTADEYAVELDSACESYQTKLEEVPRVQAEENLTLEEAGELPEQYAEEFEAQVNELEPPSDIEDGATALQDAIASPPDATRPDPEEYVAYYRELGGLFEDVGASGCADIQAQNAEALQNIQENGVFPQAG